MSERFITVAIHTYDKAVALRSLLESEGIQVEFRNVNIEHPAVSSGVRVRIHESDLPLALRIIENREIFDVPAAAVGSDGAARPVLVPVDFSDNSLRAAAVAMHIASMHKTSIIFLHTYIDPYVAGNMQLTDSLTYEISDIATREQISSTAEAQMRHFAARVKELIKKGDVPPVQFKTRVVEGVPEDAIAEYAAEQSPYLIVMGTRGPKKKEIELIGSVTAEVLDKCRNSVLAIPESSDPERQGTDRLPVFSNIVFFGNTDQQDILALDTLYRVFPKAAANVNIVALPNKKRQFMRNTQQSLSAIADYCRRNFPGYKFSTTEISDTNAEGEIRRLQQEHRFDLIVVPNKKKNIISRIFNPTIAHRILFASELPMLVIPV